MHTQKRNFTYIDELPDLEDLESSGGMYRGMHDGMSHGNPMGMPHTSGKPLQFSEQGPPRGLPEKFRKFIRSPMGPAHPESGMAHHSQHHQPPQEFFQPPPHTKESPTRPDVNSPTCLEISDHVGGCPICSRFYKNDSSIYIIAIVVLAIICILLLKRVLNL